MYTKEDIKAAWQTYLHIVQENVYLPVSVNDQGDQGRPDNEDIYREIDWFRDSVYDTIEHTGHECHGFASYVIAFIHVHLDPFLVKWESAYKVPLAHEGEVTAITNPRSFLPDKHVEYRTDYNKLVAGLNEFVDELIKSFRFDDYRREQDVRRN